MAAFKIVCVCDLYSVVENVKLVSKWKHTGEYGVQKFFPYEACSNQFVNFPCCILSFASTIMLYSHLMSDFIPINSIHMDATKYHQVLNVTALISVKSL